MDQIDAKEQDRLLKLMRKHRKRLLAYPNVWSVDIGYKFTGGRPTGRLAIRVHVRQKQPESSLTRSQRIPEKIEGIHVDVIESNPELHAVNRNARQSPVIGGVNVGSTRPGLIGTLGSIVFDRNSLQPMALSNYHIMVVLPPNAGDIIAQPKTTNAADRLGPLVRWDKALDCAVCSINLRQVSTDIADLPTGTKAIVFALVGMRVIKSGKTTGVTRGIIDGTSGSEFTVVPDPAFLPPGGEITANGDSGSLWLNADNSNAVGLHYAGELDPAPERERAWAKSMFSVADKLEITVIDRAAMGAAWVGTHCTVLGRTRPNALCHLRVIYPSGRRSTAKGLGANTADVGGWVRWSWVIGSSTKRHGAGTGRPFGIPVQGIVTLDGAEVMVESPLRGNPTT